MNHFCHDLIEGNAKNTDLGFSHPFLIGTVLFCVTMLWSGGQHYSSAGCPLQQQQVRCMNRRQQCYTVNPLFLLNWLKYPHCATSFYAINVKRKLQLTHCRSGYVGNWCQYKNTVPKHLSSHILGVQQKSLSRQVSISRWVLTFDEFYLCPQSLLFYISKHLLPCLLFSPSADRVWTPRGVISGTAHTWWDYGKSRHTKRSLEDV